VYLHAETNVDWSGRRNTLAPVTTPPITGYTENSTRSVTVPVLDVNEKTSWSDNGTGNVETKIWYGPGLDGNEQPAPANYFEVSQAPYALTASGSTSGLGMSVTVSVSTLAAQYSLRLHANTAGGSQLATTNGLTTGTSKSFIIDANTGTSQRPVIIVNGVTGNQVGSFSQVASPRFIVTSPITKIEGDAVNGVVHNCPDGYVLFKMTDLNDYRDKPVYYADGTLMTSTVNNVGYKMHGQPGAYKGLEHCILTMNNGTIYYLDYWLEGGPNQRSYYEWGADVTSKPLRFLCQLP
jgi:hypothetical protein